MPGSTPPYTAPAPVEIAWQHTRGSSEISGNATYNHSTVNLIGMFEQMPTSTRFNVVRVPMWLANGSSVVEWKIWVRSTSARFDLSSAAPVASGTITAAQMPTSASQVTLRLSSYVTVDANQYVVVILRAVTAGTRLSVSYWNAQASEAPNRHDFWNGAGASWTGTPNLLTSGVYFQSTFQLTREIAQGASAIAYNDTYALGITDAQEAIDVTLGRTDEAPRVVLPDVITATVGVPCELFTRSMVEAQDPYAVPVQITCDIGASSPRGFTVTPIEGNIGNHTLTVTTKSRGGRTLSSDTATIKVIADGSDPVSNKNVLIVGDSLTANGTWPTELYRRLRGTGGSPAGLGYTHIIGIGDLGDANAQYVGLSGWGWDDYLAAARGEVPNPFWLADPGEVNFTNYCTVNGFSGIDLAYFCLGWNDITSAYQTDFTTVITNARTLIQRLRTEYPSVKVRIVGQNIPNPYGGLSSEYGAAALANYYGYLSSMNTLLLAYQALANETELSSYVRYVGVSPQFDAEYNMPYTTVAANQFSTTMLRIGTDGRHPATAGYYQIAHAVCADVIDTLCGGE